MWLIIINNIHNIFIITNIWWITNNNIILIINIRKNVTLYKINISIINFIIFSSNIKSIFRYINSSAYTKGMKLTVLCECKSRKLLFLYNEKLLSDRLADNRVRKLLESFGYDSRMTLEQQLERLSGRISASEDFPHEIGLFLGYPVDDVTGFIRNKGRNYLLCGYWKVYSDENRARRIFNNYDKCRNYLCNKLAQGESIYQALKIS